MVGDLMELTIEALDHQGRGIAHKDGKVIFVDNALKNEVVEVEVLEDTKKFCTAKVLNYLEKNPNRVKSKCPFYEECGGCHLRHLSYADTIKFKKAKITNILSRFAGIETDIKVVKNKNRDLYRNKVEIQISDGKCGFYKRKSHDLVEIDRCLNTEEAINSVLLALNLFHIENGTITIRSNYNGEIILDIKTQNKPKIEIEKLRDKVKLVGIVLNGELLFGADHFIEIINDQLFKVSYNSFFQVNRTINEELFKIVEDSVEENATVVDMCSGVGTLSLVASKKAKKVYGIEIIPNAVKDAIVNAKMNKISNVNFMLGDAFSLLPKINDTIDTIIIDPPRSGLTEKAKKTIKEILPKKVIYISCDPITLARDLSELKETFSIEKFYILDMFSYTYHVECVCVLNRR